MGRRSKPRVKNRSKTHRARVKAGHRMRARRGARGFSPVTKKRQRAAARRTARGRKG